MKSQPEIEIKLRVSDPRALKRRLRELGFRRTTARLLERNCLFDFPDGRLAETRRALRLRRVGRRSLLTFKGAAGTSNKYKVRNEIETSVEDPDQLRKILKELQLVETFRYEKYRTTYTLQSESNAGKHPLLLYDETPVGNYVELEGPASWIDRVARQLGYCRDDYITASYTALYYEWFKRGRQKRANGPIVRRNPSSRSHGHISPRFH